MATYDNTHRAFLQAFLSKGTLTYADSKPILAAIQTADTPDRATQPHVITQEVFNAYIQSLNTAISPFDLEIRSSIPQDPSSSAAAPRLYALVNTTSDPATQLATAHTADELAFLKRVLDAMFDTHNTRRNEVLAVTSMQALALARTSAANPEEGTQAAASAGLTRAEAERCLATLVAEGWLDLSAKGYYRLSARALMELRTWLVETYNDEDEEDGVRVRSCHGCGEIVVVGQRCRDLDCGVRVHAHCLRNVLTAGGGQRCPTCKKEWTGDRFVGEKAAEMRSSLGTRDSNAGIGSE